MSSSSSRPGVRRWTCGSKKAGKTRRPSASTTSAPSAVGRCRARRARRSRRRGRRRRGRRRCPRAGSSTRAPREDQVGVGLAAPPRQSSDGDRAGAHAGSPIGVGAGSSASPALGAARALAAGEQLVEDRHPHDEPALDLRGDQRGRAVDHLRRELDAAVDRARVHEQLARAEPARVDLVVGGVLADRGHEGLVHPLALHPQRVDDVGLAEPVEVVGDLESSASSIPRGIRVGGPQRVTSAPIIRKQSAHERATRLWRTSPTIQIRLPSSAPSRWRSV